MLIFLRVTISSLTFSSETWYRGLGLNILQYPDLIFFFVLCLLKYSCNRVTVVTTFEMNILNSLSMTSFYGEPAIPIHVTNRLIQGEHKFFPWLQTLITRKLRGITNFFFSKSNSNQDVFYSTSVHFNMCSFCCTENV